MHLAARLELRERAMRVIRTRRLEPRPASKAARPIHPPHLRAPDERRVLNRLVPRPRTARTPIVRNPRLRTASGAREDDEALAGANEVDESVHFPNAFSIFGPVAMSVSV